jgi:F-type H+-transporting ATPase subunit epsilon
MLSLSVVSPVKNILETTCSLITVPTESGLITILPSHAPLFSLLNHGEVVIKNGNSEPQYILVSGGFVSVSEDKVILLTDYGAKSEELDEEVILEAKKNAEHALEESKSESLTKAAQADLFHANLELQFLYRRGKRHTSITGSRPH